jgi:mannose-6-phosphate isomerase-like protein (cupin superfamily)
MIRTGDTLQNTVTGETLTFLATAADTNGEYTLVECTVQPDGFVASPHVHPFQTETFTVVRGTLGMKAGRSTLELGPGEVAVVEPGTPHKFWNAGDTRAVFRCEVRPSLQFESLIETMFGLAEDGKTNAKGMPNPFRLAVVANAHFDTARLPVVPAALQKAALAVGAPLGRLLGYEPTYVPAGEPAFAV